MKKLVCLLVLAGCAQLDMAPVPQAVMLSESRLKVSMSDGHACVAQLSGAEFARGAKVIEGGFSEPSCAGLTYAITPKGRSLLADAGALSQLFAPYAELRLSRGARNWRFDTPQEIRED